MILELSYAESALRTLCAWLCQLIYQLIAFAYNLFINLSVIQLLQEESINNIYKRVTIILTIVMIFYVTFEFVKYIIEPETLTDKEKGAQNILKKMVIVIVLLAFVPKVFTWSYKLQNIVIKNDVISKILLGSNNKDIDTSKLGNKFSADLLNEFYYVNPYYTESGVEADCDGMSCNGIVNMNLQTLSIYGKLYYLTLGINSEDTVSISELSSDTESDVEYVDEEGTITMINFDGLLAVLVGGAVAWILILYCIDLGVRLVQLIYLQIISPIPIIGYLSPKKDGIFQKWCKQCLTTYLDVFIRLSIIYFIILLCNVILDSETFNTIVGEALFDNLYIKLAIILGLFTFAKKAPKLLQELFPSMGAASGNFGLSAKDRNLAFLPKFAKWSARTAAGTAVGAAVGVATGIAAGKRKKNAVDISGMDEKQARRAQAKAAWGGAAMGIGRGLVGGSVRGFANGAKKGNIIKNSAAAAKSVSKSSKQFGNRLENGYDLGTQLEDRFRNVVGAHSRVEEKELKKAPAERAKKAREDIANYNKSIRDHAETKVLEKNDPAHPEYAAYRAAKIKNEQYYDNNFKEKRIKELTDPSYGPPMRFDDAEKLYGEEAAAAAEAEDNAKKAAVNAYIASGEDGKIKGLIAERDARMKNFNDFEAGSDSDKFGYYKVTDSEGNEHIFDSTGAIDRFFEAENEKRKNTGAPELTISSKTSKDVTTLTPAEFNDYAKNSINESKTDYNNIIDRLSKEQEQIKRQTSGSGIGEDKK